MQQSILETYKRGLDYIDTWPNKPELINYFPQYKAVLTSRFVLRYAPPLAVLAFTLPLLLHGVEQLKYALFYGLFIASMLVQAVFFMSNQAKLLLPPSLAKWYRDGVEKLQAVNDEVNFTAQKPTFFDLAKLLRYSYNQSA
ncbi:terminus macrodomain insulation protein YfbV [Thalassotalea ponticola]|uniref:terminus macrodomain insulation protein YfbV n=1 Tax=Thalassotalea ponticola TaxID=1523392 RepID=UPI0025B2C0FE|nr:terminus macrodomain insulation protein YfbV [Thalassotalea ponticola]MDN3651247.1 terminus macrodomain insulation protein YfbV [Thalassotalea ponticola]